MDKPTRYKAKNKKPATKPKAAKKRKSDVLRTFLGPTCSMFLTELSRKLALKKRQEEEPQNVVQTIIDSITNALPVKFSRKSPPNKESPLEIGTLQIFAPELLPNDTLEVTQAIPEPDPEPEEIEMAVVAKPQAQRPGIFKMPRMPLVSSDVFKAVERRPVPKKDASVNTGSEHDVASELARHVGTLKKISLIAEEFNQKTAKNLKEIVDSVQEDLIKKLEEIQSEQQASKGHDKSSVISKEK